MAHRPTFPLPSTAEVTWGERTLSAALLCPLPCDDGARGGGGGWETGSERAEPDLCPGHGSGTGLWNRTAEPRMGLGFGGGGPCGHFRRSAVLFGSAFGAALQEGGRGGGSGTEAPKGPRVALDCRPFLPRPQPLVTEGGGSQ